MTEADAVGLKNFAWGSAERTDVSPRLGLETAERMLNRFRIYRATISELKQLSDRDLADLGLRRGMIRRLAREAARRA